jgi:hypothetical protein
LTGAARLPGAYKRALQEASSSKVNDPSLSTTPHTNSPNSQGFQLIQALEIINWK